MIIKTSIFIFFTTIIILFVYNEVILLSYLDAIEALGASIIGGHVVIPFIVSLIYTFIVKLNLRYLPIKEKRSFAFVLGISIISAIIYFAVIRQIYLLIY